MQNQELLNQKKIVDKFLTEVYSKEKEEIDSWNMSTPRLVDFKPSKELISLIKGVCSGRFNFEFYLRKQYFKIEANVAVVSGQKSIIEAFQEFKNKCEKMNEGEFDLESLFQEFNKNQLQKHWYKISTASGDPKKYSDFWLKVPFWGNIPESNVIDAKSEE